MSYTAVVDNSALIEFLVNPKPNIKLAQRMTTGTIAAPELIDAEALKVVQGLNRSGKLTNGQATAIMRNIQDLPIVRFAHRHLLERAWAIRHSVSAFDSLYVAPAEQLDVPLLTCDEKSTGSNSHGARFEVYPIS
jgi:predicted nucleic acid-binding protein